jgi:hypothetical protein
MKTRSARGDTITIIRDWNYFNFIKKHKYKTILCPKQDSISTKSVVKKFGKSSPESFLVTGFGFAELTNGPDPDLSIIIGLGA